MKMRFRCDPLYQPGSNEFFDKDFMIYYISLFIITCSSQAGEEAEAVEYKKTVDN